MSDDAKWEVSIPNGARERHTLNLKTADCMVEEAVGGGATWRASFGLFSRSAVVKDVEAAKLAVLTHVQERIRRELEKLKEDQKVIWKLLKNCPECGEPGTYEAGEHPGVLECPNKHRFVV